jgi:hypothetical protein
MKNTKQITVSLDSTTPTGERAWLNQLPADPAAIPIQVTLTLDAATWATVAHDSRRRGETIDQVLSSFILDGGLGGIAEHLQTSSRGN